MLQAIQEEAPALFLNVQLVQIVVPIGVCRRRFGRRASLMTGLGRRGPKGRSSDARSTLGPPRDCIQDSLTELHPVNSSEVCKVWAHLGGAARRQIVFPARQ